MSEVRGVDLVSISLGAGVQSSCMYLMSVVGVLPRADVAIFADVGGLVDQVEPPWVYEQLDYLESVGGETIPIIRATGGNLRDHIELAIDGQRGRFASVPFWVESNEGKAAPGRRQCTRELKIDVVKRTIREQLGLAKGERAAGRCQVEEWIGISLDEAHRAKPSRYKWVTSRWPLLYDRPMRRHECEQWMKDQGHPIPRKSACSFCPFRSNEEWRMVRDELPDEWERICDMDRRMRAAGPLKGMKREQYLHRSLVPLAEADIEASSQLDLWGNECEGMCGQ